MNNIPNTGTANNATRAQQHAATNVVGGRTAARVDGNRPQPPLAAAAGEIGANSTRLGVRFSSVDQVRRFTRDYRETTDLTVPSQQATETLSRWSTGESTPVFTLVLRELRASTLPVPAAIETMGRTSSPEAMDNSPKMPKMPKRSSD